MYKKSARYEPTSRFLIDPIFEGKFTKKPATLIFLLVYTGFSVIVNDSALLHCLMILK